MVLIGGQTAPCGTLARPTSRRQLETSVTFCWFLASCLDIDVRIRVQAGCVHNIRQKRHIGHGLSGSNRRRETFCFHTTLEVTLVVRPMKVWLSWQLWVEGGAQCRACRRLQFVIFNRNRRMALRLRLRSSKSQFNNSVMCFPSTKVVITTRHQMTRQTAAQTAVSLRLQTC